MRRGIIIALDGYSSTGKSTFAKMIARKLGYIYIDTGAIYRAITLYAINSGFIINDSEINTELLLKSIKEERISVYFRTLPPENKSCTFLNGANVENEIRTLKVSGLVSIVAAIPFVREFVDIILHRIGQEGGVVMDGRDIGTAVFPNAQLKIFMTADPEIRAERRLKEMLASGENAKFEDVLENIRKRDYMDTHRATSPLTMAPDAILLDNSHLTLDEQLLWIEQILQQKQII